LGMISAFMPSGDPATDIDRMNTYHYSEEFGHLPGVPVMLAELGIHRTTKHLHPVSFSFSKDAGGRRITQLREAIEPGGFA